MTNLSEWFNTALEAKPKGSWQRYVQNIAVMMFAGVVFFVLMVIGYGGL